MRTLKKNLRQNEITRCKGPFDRQEQKSEKRKSLGEIDGDLNNHKTMQIENHFVGTCIPYVSIHFLRTMNRLRSGPF